MNVKCMDVSQEDMMKAMHGSMHQVMMENADMPKKKKKMKKKMKSSKMMKY